MVVKFLSITNHNDNRHTRHMSIDGRLVDIVQYFDSDLDEKDRFRLFEQKNEILGVEKDETLARCLSHFENLRNFFD